MSKEFIEVTKYCWLGKDCLGIRPFVIPGKVIKVFLKKGSPNCGKILVRFENSFEVEYNFINNEVVQNRIPCLIIT